MRRWPLFLGLAVAVAAVAAYYALDQKHKQEQFQRALYEENFARSERDPTKLPAIPIVPQQAQPMPKYGEPVSPKPGNADLELRVQELELKEHQRALEAVAPK